MSRLIRWFIWIACIISVILACILAGCTSNQNTALVQATPKVTAVPQVTQVTQDHSATQTPRNDANSITIKQFAFNPATLTVKPGDKVTWTNQDRVAHTIVSDPGSATQFSSEQLANGASYTFTFTQPGTFSYHCSIHPSMKGTIVVQS